MNTRSSYFTHLEWRGFWIVAWIAFSIYLFTLAPDVTMEDSGEFLTAAYHWGVPHPPGYPIWTISANLFSHLIPFGGVAWKVNMMSAFYGALAAGMTSLIVSKVARRLLDMEMLRDFQIADVSRDGLGLMAGIVSGLILAFIDTMWSQAVITEVYTMNNFFFTALCLLVLRWFDAPRQWRWPCLIAFVFGLGITNHQTLMVCAPAFLFAMYVADVALYVNVAPIAGAACCVLAWKGSFQFLWIFGGGFLLHYAWLMLSSRQFWNARNLFCALFCVMVSCGAMTILAREESRWIWIFITGATAFLWIILGAYHLVMRNGVIRLSAPLLLSFLMLVAGSGFYVYMPISSLTNPPMNWGYTRTPEGFRHHILRGQYEPIKTNRPVDVLFRQYQHFFFDFDDNFGTPLLFLGIITLLLSFEFQKKEQDYLGFTVICLFMMGFVLVYLLNPKFDAQSVFINRVFYGLAHEVFAIWIGFGTIFLLFLLKKLRQRLPLLLIGLVAAILSWVGDRSGNPWEGKTIWICATALYLITLTTLLSKRRPRTTLGMVYALPLIPLAMNWSGSEMRGHDFGWRYGHDMLIHMDRNAVLYGGTDPGRFVPTYMIFGDSFQPKKWRRDPSFDRRDLYIITQNALADFTYMDYIRDHYSTQRPKMDQWYHRLLGRDKLYPKDPLILPTPDQFNAIFARTIEENQSKSNSGIVWEPDPEGRGVRATVKGFEGVFMINAAVAQWIFNQNKDRHTFYVEESFPLAWMYPYLEPDGLIMKLAKEPLTGLSREAVARDMAYWGRLLSDLMENPAFLRDDVARKSYSKLRGSIGGLYLWRGMSREAEKALQQSIEIYPANGESRTRLIDLYLPNRRFDDAMEQAYRWFQVDPNNSAPGDTLAHIQEIKSIVEKADEMEKLLPSSRYDPVFVFQYASILRSLNKSAEMDAVIDTFLNQSPLDIKGWQTAVQFYAQAENPHKVKELLKRLCKRDPRNALAWLNLAAVQLVLSERSEALESLRQTLKIDPKMRSSVVADERFNSLHEIPEYQKIISSSVSTKKP